MKTNVMILVFVFIAAFLLPGCSFLSNERNGGSKTYYVSKKGKDNNPGTKRKPLLTISAAALLAMPGDTVMVYEGIYRERINPPRGGLSDDMRITYKAAPGNEVVITGSEVITGWEKLENDTWTVSVSNTLFGDFNPYSDLIRGDWFNGKGRLHHTGAVYSNGHWLNEAATKEEVLALAGEIPLWFAYVNDKKTTFWAQFKDGDPNEILVEINVRQTVFYPEKTRINYITVNGFIMRHAATNWAPPTSEQIGLVGANWSKGWIIENNDISYSKCTGITLGKYGDEFDNTSANTAKGYVFSIEQALRNGWNKDSVGSHIVRNNRISYCEQAGIVGSLGCAFSTITGNIIHDIHVHRLFTGAEMAGIKFHGPVDTEISYNRIFNTTLGIWLDWMAQGSVVHNNLLYQNTDQDLYYEVTHGPLLTYNNICLSRRSLLDLARGSAFAHNLFAGYFAMINFDSRLTPYLMPNATEIAGMYGNPSGDQQFYNNLFVGNSDVSDYSETFLPVVFDGNVYTKGSTMATGRIHNLRFGELHENAREQMGKYTVKPPTERNATVVQDFDSSVRLIEQGDEVFLEINIDKNWLSMQRNLVTTETFTNAIVTDQAFMNIDGSPVRIDHDYFGNARNTNNPSPGPFEIFESGKQTLKVWPVRK